MTDANPIPDEDNAAGPPNGPGGRSFASRFLDLAADYWSSEEKLAARTLTFFLIVLTMAQIVVPVLINRWSASFFDALEQRSMEQFLIQVGALVLILITNVVVTATHLWVKRKLQVGWRKWLTRKALREWMAQGRHYQISYMPGEHDNPDGRIAEDIRITTEVALDLAHSVLYCFLLLLSFTQILWRLSGVLPVTLGDVTIGIPGHMVLVALLYASAGTAGAMVLARPLVRAHNRRQTVEANFRFGLVRARENSEAIALIHGEDDERRRFRDLLRFVEGGWNAQTSALTRLFMFSSGYSVLSTGFPLLVAAPRYIAGALSLGELMQIAQAFQQMTAALSWPIDNLSKVAEWRASVERVLGLHDVLQDLQDDIAYMDENTISVERAPGDSLIFQGLAVADPDGQPVLHGFNGKIDKGERVLITGDPDAAMKLFKVVAKLWPWGQGQVILPQEASIFFMPQRPYLPIGTLRGALSYPSAPDGFATEQIVAAVKRVGLERFADSLDDSNNWERILSGGDCQRAGFARLLLHRPDWIFILQATDALDPHGEEEMMQLLEDEFPAATVLTIGYHAALEAYHQRGLLLERSSEGPVRVKDSRERREAARAPAKTGPIPWSNRLFKQLWKRGERRG